METKENAELRYERAGVKNPQKLSALMELLRKHDTDVRQKTQAQNQQCYWAVCSYGKTKEWIMDNLTSIQRGVLTVLIAKRKLMTH